MKKIKREEGRAGGEGGETERERFVYIDREKREKRDRERVGNWGKRDG